MKSYRKGTLGTALVVPALLIAPASGRSLSGDVQSAAYQCTLGVPVPEEFF